MLDTQVKYSLKDISIVPSELTVVLSRKECNPRDKYDHLPIISAPMFGIVNQNNWEFFNSNGIYSMIPRYRKEDWDSFDAYMDEIQQGIWAAISIKDFEDWFCNENSLIGQECAHYNICIDTANGHMKKIYELCDEAKQLAKIYNYEIEIMVGNIANPETIRHCWNFKGELIVDYMRLGIGGGQCCTTTHTTGIHYPMASLIDECYKKRNELKWDPILDDEDGTIYREGYPKLVADGGIRDISDIIKCLALGADYVMVGTILAACEESCAPIKFHEGEGYKEFYGMSTVDSQKYYKEGEIRRSEGRKIILKPEYNLKQFINEFEDYMRSAMSYANAKNLSQFRPKCIVMSNKTQKLQKR